MDRNDVMDTSRSSRVRSSLDGKELPHPRNALQFVFAAVRELETGPDGWNLLSAKFSRSVWRCCTTHVDIRGALCGVCGDA